MVVQLKNPQPLATTKVQNEKSKPWTSNAAKAGGFKEAAVKEKMMQQTFGCLFTIHPKIQSEMKQ